MVRRDQAELVTLVEAASATIRRANVAASAVLSVVGDLNEAQAAFLRSPSVRYQVELRLASRYEGQCEPLERAATLLEGELTTLAGQHQEIVTLARADPTVVAIADPYLRGIVKLSTASVLATTELAGFPDALDWLGQRLTSLVPATDRLSPSMRRVLVALRPAVGWGEDASALLRT